MGTESLVVSCEHATNRIPASYRSLFRGAGTALRSHRGWDIGAARVATALARACGAALFLGRASRLLIDLNRSRHHPALLSEWTRRLGPDERRELVERHYQPYRDAVADRIRAGLRDGNRVLHISVHSFTPLWNGALRTADIGLLYDPAHPAERALCAGWQDAFEHVTPQLRVRRNYPYRGTSDGFSVALRRELRTRRYTCVELEINQALLGKAPTARAVAGTIVRSLDRVRQRD